MNPQTVVSCSIKSFQKNDRRIAQLHGIGTNHKPQLSSFIDMDNGLVQFSENIDGMYFETESRSVVFKSWMSVHTDPSDGRLSDAGRHLVKPQEIDNGELSSPDVDTLRSTCLSIMCVKTLC